MGLSTRAILRMECNVLKQTRTRRGEGTERCTHRWAVVLMMLSTVSSAFVVAPGAVEAAEGRGVHDRPPQEGVARVPLVPKPGWSVSGVWSTSGDSLLLVDAKTSQVLEYRRTGELVRRLTVPMEGTTVFSRPSWIRRWPGGYIVEQEDAGFVTVNPTFEARQGFDLMEATRGTDLGSVAVFQWATLSSEELVALGDVQEKTGQWKSGLLRVRLGHPPRVEMVTELRGDPEDLDVYLVGLQYLTSLGGRGYFVEMSETPPVLVEIRPEPDGGTAVRRVPIFSETTRGGLPLFRPYLSELGAVNEMPGVFAELERSFMVSGLYAWEGRLYLLIRRPRQGVAGSTWSLATLDPESGIARGRIDLPTTAAHVTLIPGPESWAVLEKGPVRGFGQQDIPSLLLLPSSHFRVE